MASDQEIAAAQLVLRDGRCYATPGPELIPLTTAKMHKALEAAERVRAPKAFACAGGAELRKLHRDRALQAIAEHHCSTDLTDGFCGPRDGVCASTSRSCIASAESILRLLESRGLALVWEHDPALEISIRKRK